MTGSLLAAFRSRAEREPIGVDISDFSDEYCAGFLAGQANVLTVLDDPETYAYAMPPGWFRPDGSPWAIVREQVEAMTVLRPKGKRS